MGAVDHQPHMLRPEFGEWCGGTMPPTTVTYSDSNNIAAVDVFSSDVDIHDGFIHKPTETKRFSHNHSLTIDSVTELALKAVGLNNTRI